MNKSELVTAAAKKSGFTKKDTAEAIDAVFSAIMDAIAAGDTVNIVGFGKFYSIKKEEREGTSPSTGEKITLPATVTPKFKAGAGFKNAVKNA